MIKGYSLRPIEDKDISIFDTIRYVSKKTGLPLQRVVQELGFEDLGNIFDLILQPPGIHFNIGYFLVGKLNRILRQCDIPVRITQKNNNYFEKRKKL